MSPTIVLWQRSLAGLVQFYEAKRGPLVIFFPLLFVFFVGVNIFCYWWAMYTAFPWLTVGGAGVYYAKVQYPVGILGALFDSLSFFVTLFIIRRAIKSLSTLEYVSHLSVDLIIAILATFWVVFVFSVSGWIVHQFDAVPQTLAARSDKYEQLVIDAVENPTDNLRNIYFGLIMGVSAMIPTCIHLSMFFKASLQSMFGQVVAEEIQGP